jgi:hypothetical protein
MQEGEPTTWAPPASLSSGLASLPFRPARRKDYLPMPRAPARRLGGRRTAAHRLFRCRIGHDEPALLCPSIHKSRLITRRRLRDMNGGHGSNSALKDANNTNGHGGREMRVHPASSPRPWPSPVRRKSATGLSLRWWLSPGFARSRSD